MTRIRTTVYTVPHGHAVLPFAVGHCGLADFTFDELYELFESGI